MKIIVLFSFVFILYQLDNSHYEVLNAHMDEMKEIKVSVSMGSDHLPDKYFLAAHDVLQSE
jgi:hypothetical protein